MIPRSVRNSRAFSAAQRAWDNMTPEDVYGPDDPEPDEEPAPEEEAIEEPVK